MDETVTGSSALKSPWVWGWIGMIVIVMAANVTMIHFARSTSPGLVVKDYYEKGKNYDRTLRERQQEKTLGWQVIPELPQKIIVNQVFSIVLSIVGEDGEIFLPDEATVYLFRPSDASADFSVALKLNEKGMLMAELDLPLPGRWDIIFSLSRGDESKEVPYRVFVDKVGRGLSQHLRE
ncbi:MAG: FixH family protein [Proteobacteria bacterium]|nr:FixH family protein [Pseudomonadota bacterium]